MNEVKKIARLIVLSDAKKYNDKTLRLGVITLDMKNAILSRIYKTKEHPISYAIFRCEGINRR